MTALSWTLAAVALFAVLAAVAAVSALLRARAALGAQRATLRGALDVAGAASLEEAVAIVVEARRRGQAGAGLLPAIDEIVERHARLGRTIAARQSAGSAAEAALGGARGALEQAATVTTSLIRDVGSAGAAVEETVASISTVTGNIGGIADNVASVSSAIGELAVSISQVAGSAREASTLSVEADRKAKDGAGAVERLVRSTREIADDIGSVVAKMEELGNASDRIGAIVEVIDAIADQTNLLALNAAIEAARAGEHGRGFAVVADEVRKLAESSAQSTREIGLLVKDIQAKTTEVVRSTTASGNKAESGLEMADLAGRAIGDISAAVGEANRLIEQISLAAREQAAGSSAIANSVEQMNGLMREAAQSLDEQNLSNRQIIDVIATIQRHAVDVEGAVERQRAAFADLARHAQSLTAVTSASTDAWTSLDGIGEALRERVVALAGTSVPALR